MTEGSIVCCGLVAVGLLLQQLIGPIRWDMMAWPMNVLVLVVLLFGILMMHLCRRKVRLFRWMGTLQAGIPAMVACAMLTLLMGVTRQVPSGHQPTESIGITSMLSFWPFVLSYLWLIILVGMVCLTRLRLPIWPNIPFLLNHFGLFLALVTGTLGNADMQRLRMIVQEGKTEWRAVDAQNRLYELPMAIELHDFSIEYHDNSTEPRSFASDVTVHTKGGLVVRDAILVNKPLAVNGWKIYQYSYDEAKGNLSEISVLELVHDPWLPYVYLGIFMMLAGAISMFIRNPSKENTRRNGKLD